MNKVDNFLDFKEEVLKDPEIRKEYDKLQPKYDSIIRGIEDAYYTGSESR